MSKKQTCPHDIPSPQLPKPALIDNLTATAAPIFAPKLVIVEGNISAGKTTLSRALAKRLDFELFLEPVVENPFLEKFYGNPKRYAFPMQMWFLKQRFGTYLRAIRMLFNTEGEKPVRGIIMDRSIFSDAVFAMQNFKDGNITQNEYNEYSKVREEMLAGLPLPHIAVYLDVSPSECHDRIHNMRKRACESSIPLQYLQGLHDCHKNMLDTLHESSKCTVLNVKWDKFGDPKQVSAKIADVPTPEMTADGTSQLLHMLASKESMQRTMDSNDFAAKTLGTARAPKPEPLDLCAEGAETKRERKEVTTPVMRKCQSRTVRQSPCSVTAPQLKLP